MLKSTVSILQISILEKYFFYFFINTAPNANVARLMRAAVGGELTLLKVSRELKLANLAVHYPWGVNPLANHGTHQCAP